ncbi:MAG: CPBP family intramembrane metalloprotease, partial [Enterococcus sp.]|nr:CPBP family intramembrane metalloprotease [Enterococcus sp.]
VLSPIMEEVVFRGGIIGLAFKDHAFLGVWVSSILYSILLQPETFICGLLYLLVNSILGLAYVKTGRLIVPLLIKISACLIVFFLI